MALSPFAAILTFSFCIAVLVSSSAAVRVNSNASFAFISLPINVLLPLRAVSPVNVTGSSGSPIIRRPLLPRYVVICAPLKFSFHTGLTDFEAVLVLLAPSALSSAKYVRLVVLGVPAGI